MQPLREVLNLPSRRDAIRAGALALVTAVACWYFGVNVWHSILLGCSVTVLLVAARAVWSTPALHDLSWRYRSRISEGSRNDVANLSQSLRSASWGPVGLTADRRLIQIARRRLALEGLDLQNPDHREAIERRIGPRAYMTVSRPDGRRPRLATLVRCLDDLDALNPQHYAPPPRSRRSFLGLRPSNLRRTHER